MLDESPRTGGPPPSASAFHATGTSGPSCALREKRNSSQVAKRRETGAEKERCPARSGIIQRRMRHVLLYAVLSLLLGVVIAQGVGLYVQFVLDESECVGETWIGRAVCGDSAYAVIAVCIGIAAVLVVGGSYLVRRLRHPLSR
jgi:hypothetical protein